MTSNCRMPLAQALDDMVSHFKLPTTIPSCISTLPSFFKIQVNNCLFIICSFTYIPSGLRPGLTKICLSGLDCVRPLQLN